MRGAGVVGLAMLGLLAGCVQPAAVRPPAAAPGAGRVTSDDQCRASLDELGIDFQVVAPFSNERGCGIQDGVKLSSQGVDLNQPAQLSCQLAVAFANFEYEFIQPLADEMLGQPVTRVYHAGTYACRDQRGRTARGLSEHAKGKAIDIVGFDLGDGSTVNVARDWRAGGPKAQFLRALARRACQRFDVVLTPEHDQAHHDHLHLDLSGKKYCGV